MTKKKAIELFDYHIKQYMDPNDKQALRLAWDGFIGSLYENRDITKQQLKNWENPFNGSDEL